MNLVLLVSIQRLLIFFHPIVQPPSLIIDCPLIYFESSESKKQTIFDMSVEFPHFFVGILDNVQLYSFFLFS